MNWSCPFAVVLAAAASMPAVRAGELEAGPYVQHVGPSSAWVLWQGHSGTRLAWGEDETLGERTLPRSTASGVREVRLSGLEPGTTYFYALVDDDERGEVHSFRTAPSDPLASTRILAIADSQMNYGEPAIFGDLVQDISDQLRSEAGVALSEHLDFVLLPGDLVDDGRQAQQWIEDFLGPAQPLMSSVPLYAALGNHEEDAGHYFDYLHLPSTDRSLERGERWYGFDRGNLRVLVLDSNEPYADQPQLEWLERQLARACVNDGVDFVIAAYHHPPYCEVWPDGQSAFSQQAVAILDAFASSCDKPVLSAFGHAHGYARGESRDARQLLVDVASISGPLHEWGRMENLDHPEIALSLPEYGYVIIEAEAGDDPLLRIERYLLHGEDTALDHSLRDRVELHRYAEAPAAPRATLPLDDNVSPVCVQLAASPWEEVSGEIHGAHWQVSERCDDFDEPSWEAWLQDTNLYKGVDAQAGHRLESTVVPSLEAEADHCWRVRYRSEDLFWSDWSRPVAFETGSATLPENLLDNPGAEEGVVHWEALEGPLQLVEAEECGDHEPVAGSSSLALCGACEEGWFVGRIGQTVSVEAHADAIDAGEAVLRWGGWARSATGYDYVSFILQPLDHAGFSVGDEQRWTFRSQAWSRSLRHTVLPAGTRSLRFEILASNVRPEHDCATFVDDLELRLDTSALFDACVTPPDYPDPLPEDTGQVDTQPPEDTDPPPADTAQPWDSEPTLRAARPPELAPPPTGPRSCGLPASHHRDALLIASLLAGWLLVRVRRREQADG
jgi:hypothetical protein